MKYSFDSKIRYSEIGIDGKLTLPALIDYFQDCSNFQSEELGVGLRYLQDKRRAWILAGWQILIHRFPKMAESVRISTWASEFKAFYGNRNFTLSSKEGEMLAAANSTWVYMDIDKKKPVRPSEEEVSAYGIDSALSLPFGTRKVVIPKDGGKQMDEIKVVEHHLDTNCHVNNGQYVRMAMNFLPEAFRVRELHVEYKTQAYLDDIIVPVVYQSAGETVVSLNTESDKPYAIVKFG